MLVPEDRYVEIAWVYELRSRRDKLMYPLFCDFAFGEYKRQVVNGKIKPYTSTGAILTLMRAEGHAYPSSFGHSLKKAFMTEYKDTVGPEFLRSGYPTSIGKSPLGKRPTYKKCPKLTPEVEQYMEEVRIKQATLSAEDLEEAVGGVPARNDKAESEAATDSDEPEFEDVEAIKITKIHKERK